MGLFDGAEIEKLKAELQRVRSERDQIKGGYIKLKAELDRVREERAQFKANVTERFDKFKAEFNRMKDEFSRTKDERDQLRVAMSDVSRMEAYGLQQAVAEMTAQREQALRGIETDRAAGIQRRKILEQEISSLIDEIAAKREDVVQLDELALLQSFGFYQPKYDLASSVLYKAKLNQIQAQQAKMIKDGTAAHGAANWSLNNSQKEGERMIKEYVKLILRAFNNECDASLVKVKFSNVDSIEKQIRKAYEALNKLGERMSIAITPPYLELKLQELYLLYEYQMKKNEEKEAQKLVKQQMREEAKLIKEIEEARAKLEKEEMHFNRALGTLNEQIDRATTEGERKILEIEKVKIEEKLGRVEQDIASVEKRERSTRAGYVYVISNIGSFGEHVYKIGVTRRLEPQERVDELGDASVPFQFDVHALIFSDDAPSLETALHHAFEHRRLNRINRRREFFRVTLEEIETVVKTNFAKPVEFIRLADAPEYRQSLMLKKGTTGALVDLSQLVDSHEQN